MNVEVFEIEDVRNETEPESQEALEMIETLGLSGQKSLIEAAPDDGQRRHGYRKITQEEKVVYQCLCPQSTPVDKYADSHYPFRVLQIIAHARDCFDNLVVWHPRGQIKDPVLIGESKDPTAESWRGPEQYILCRWGEELDEFPALLKKAAQRYKECIVDKLLAIKRKVAANLVDMECFTTEEFIAKANNEPYFSW